MNTKYQNVRLAPLLLVSYANDYQSPMSPWTAKIVAK